MPVCRGSSRSRVWTLVSYVYLYWQANSLPLVPPGKPHYRHTLFYCTLASQVVLLLKNPPASAGDVRNLGSIPGYGKSPEGGHGNPLQYSSLEPGGLQSIGSQRVKHSWSHWACMHANTIVFTSWRRGSLVSSKVFGTIFQTTFVPLVSLLHFSSCHNISSFIILCYSNLWSVIFAVSLVIIFEVPNNSHTSRWTWVITVTCVLTALMPALPWFSPSPLASLFPETTDLS